MEIIGFSSLFIISAIGVLILIFTKHDYAIPIFISKGVLPLTVIFYVMCFMSHLIGLLLMLSYLFYILLTEIYKIF